jgi:hypothetical protein
MEFPKMMFAVHRWYRSHSRVDDAFPLKLTFEVGNVEIAAQVFDEISKEMVNFTFDMRVMPIDLHRPFHFMGIIVEFKLRPRQDEAVKLGSRHEEVNHVSRETLTEGK